MGVFIGAEGRRGGGGEGGRTRSCWRSRSRHETHAMLLLPYRTTVQVLNIISLSVSLLYTFFFLSFSSITFSSHSPEKKKKKNEASGAERCSRRVIRCKVRWEQDQVGVKKKTRVVYVYSV